jgi:hypothetical protein
MLTRGILPQAMHLRILQPNKANQKVLGCQKQKLLVSQLQYNPRNRRKRLESKPLYSFFSIFIDGERRAHSREDTFERMQNRGDYIILTDYRFCEFRDAPHLCSS